ncbi:MAG: hypothetical protein L0Y54_00500 [Sporichthyaceae bacterium]|nr:hypothetical protein [Sporichthyaceae bacterium]
MIAIAVVLIIAALILTIGAVAGGSSETSFDIFQGSVSASGSQIFLLGLVTGLMFILGLKTLQIGARRARIRGKELRDLRATKRELDRREQAARAAEEADSDGDGERSTRDLGLESDRDGPERRSVRSPFDVDRSSFRSDRFRDSDDR